MGSSDLGVFLGGDLHEIIEANHAILIPVSILNHGGNLIVGEPLSNRVSHQRKLSLSEMPLIVLIELIKETLKGGLRLGITREPKDLQEPSKVNVLTMSMSTHQVEDLLGVALQT